jgi:hypothetical protein
MMLTCCLLSVGLITENKNDISFDLYRYMSEELVLKFPAMISSIGMDIGKSLNKHCALNDE